VQEKNVENKPGEKEDRSEKLQKECKSSGGGATGDKKGGRKEREGIT